MSDAGSAVMQLTLPDAHPWEPPEPIDPDARAVLAVLRDGRTHLKAELQLRTGLTERAVRAAIELLRRQLWPVCSSSGKAGYTLSWSNDSLDALERDLTARALSTLRTRSAIRRLRQRRSAA